MFSHAGSSAHKKGLANIIKLCEELGNPQNKFKSIHIAGTNGKGSSSNMLAAIMQQSGYKTGLYSSPHLFDFGERIRVNGQMVNPQFVIDFTQKTQSICDAIEPSFFELTVAMAFEYFAQEKVDIAIIETGLGGRLDSTNIIIPILSIITNIGFDHMQILGNSLTEIAGEKAGIIKQNIPVVIGNYNDESKRVFKQKSLEMNAPLVYATTHFKLIYAKTTVDKLHCSILNIPANKTLQIITDLAGIYQAQNICTVLTAIECLKKTGYVIEDTIVSESLRQIKKITGLRGRWDLLQTRPDVIIDVGHNEDGIKNIVAQLGSQYPNARQHFVIGFAKDKDLNRLLDLFPKNALYYFTNAHLPRALPHTALKKLAAEKHVHGNSYDHVDEAINHALANANESDVVMVCGSFFVIAETTCFKNS